MHGWYGDFGSGGYAWGFPWGGLIMGAIFLVLVVLAVFWAARLGKSSPSSKGSAAERGIEILTERFARGEIDAAAYKAMKAEIEDKS